MEIKSLYILLVICLFFSCGPDDKEAIEPEQPPIEKPEQPEKPDIPDKPEKPQKPAPIDGIINVNNEYMVVGTKKWNAIAFGNGKYITVGDDMNLTSSTDGENWETPKKVGGISGYVNYPLYTVIYENGKYIAAGNSGYYVTSTDGTNWSNAQKFESGNWRCLTFINGKFVAINSNGKANVSTNGQNWTSYTTGTSTAYNLVYGNGIYMTVGEMGKVATSVNGTNWELKTTLSGQNFKCSVYGNGKFVVANNADRALKLYVSSDNGISWSTCNLTPVSVYSEINCMTYGNGKFIAIDQYSNIYTSTDGIDWEINTKKVPFTYPYGMMIIQ